MKKKEARIQGGDMKENDSRIEEKASESQAPAEGGEPACDPEMQADARAEAGTGPDEAGTPGKESGEDWKARLAEMNDKYLRLYSDFDNYRKRSNRERLEMEKTASTNVVLALLPVIDDMERALKAFREAGSEEEAALPAQQALFEGVDLIYNKLLNVLKQQGVRECEVLGRNFDAETAEAVAQIPAPDESRKGVVLDVIQKGYAIEGKVIRFAKVVVGC